VDLTRRQVLYGMGATIAWSGIACGDAAKDDALDDGLRRIHRREPDSVRGLSTHAPMAIEALAALGHADRIDAWLDRYRGPVLQLPRAGKRIDPKQWRDALGPNIKESSWERANARWGDWVELFVAELAAAPWHDVVDRWVSRLAPGMSGAATHGAIRTSHAARALGRRDTPERRAELARGLAYWASSYEEIRGRGRRVDAVDKLPLYSSATGHRPPDGSITDVLRHISEVEAFPSQVEIAGDLGALTQRFAHVYLDHGTSHDAIAFVHAVTGPCSLRRLAPFVQPATARAALPHAWQAASAIYTMYARTDDAHHVPRPTMTRDELIARAIDGGNEHAIKFTETMLVEYSLDPDPVYLAAAEDAIAKL
jgi:hypothetical protein